MEAEFKLFTPVTFWLFQLLVPFSLLSPLTETGTFAEEPGWSPANAARSLDRRAEAWFNFVEADLGAGATKTSCVSCHTLLPYALARPSLRKWTGEKSAGALEKRLLEESAIRVENWSDIRNAKLGLPYNDPDQKKLECEGTEVVFRALFHALDDRQSGLKSASEVTEKAFALLWKLQRVEEPNRGSWNWLNYDLEPWESSVANEWGAALAAIAVDAKPHGFGNASDAESKGLGRLREFLKSRIERQNLHNRAWTLWAMSLHPGWLSDQERFAMIDSLLAKQRDDGGWRIADLGNYARSDKTPQDSHSDAYATGLILHAALVARFDPADRRVSAGLQWLKKNQRSDGSWTCQSVNQARDPDSHIGRFFSDFATAMAVMALSH